MARYRLIPLFAVGIAVVGACGLDAVGQLDVTAEGGAPPGSADGSLATDAGSGGDSNVSIGTDAGGDATGADASDGAAVTPACAAGKVHCGGSCVTATDCTACAGAEYLCAPTRKCVASCATCTDLVSVAMPIGCFACDPGQNNPVGTCSYNSTAGFCLSGDYSAAYRGGAGEHCDCSNTDVGNCPGAGQVCKPNGGTDWCITCGESGEATNGLPCKGGGNCNTGVSPPRCM